MIGRGQASFEYLIITGFMLLVAGIIFGFSLFSFNENSRMAQAQEAVNRIASNADLVASLGDGSRVYFEVDIPEGIESLGLSGRSVVMQVNSGFGVSDIQRYSRHYLETAGGLPSSRGRFTFSAQFIDGNVVLEAS